MTDNNTTMKVRGTEDFECPLCMKLFYEPVTTPCGHTFCRCCLTRALDHGQACPLCRSIMHLASEPPVTVVLQKIIEKNFPHEISVRKEEMMEERSLDVAWSDKTLPLFPLKHVAFPGMTFPLHIFEPKYRLMIRRCMAGSRCFGIVNVHLSSNGSWVPYNVGCMVSISKITILMDGRSIINCKGLRRFKIIQKWDQDGYLVGKVQCFGDDPVKEEELAPYSEITQKARQMVENIIANEGRLESLQKMLGQAGTIPSDDLEFSFWMSSLLPISPEHKQEMLETTSTPWRYARLVRIVERVTYVLQHGNDVVYHGLEVRNHTNERAEGSDGDGIHPAYAVEGREDMLVEATESAPAVRMQERSADGDEAPRFLGSPLYGDGVGPNPRGHQTDRLGSDACSAS